MPRFEVGEPGVFRRVKARSELVNGTALTGRVIRGTLAADRGRPQRGVRRESRSYARGMVCEEPLDVHSIFQQGKVIDQCVSRPRSGTATAWKGHMNRLIDLAHTLIYLTQLIT